MATYNSVAPVEPNITRAGRSPVVAVATGGTGGAKPPSSGQIWPRGNKG